MGVLQPIGAVAEGLGLTTRTLRYYEQLGLLQPTQRAGRGPRLYDDAARNRLHLIRRMRAAGLSLQTIRLVLDLRSEISQLDDEPVPLERLEEIVADVRARHAGVRARVRELEDQLAQARGLERQLAHDLQVCQAHLAQRRAAREEESKGSGR